MKASEAFNLLPATPEEVAGFSSKLIEEIESGELDALKFKIFLKGIETVLSNIKPTLDAAAISDAEKYGQKSFELIGAKVELKELGVKYDFSNCGHPDYAKIDSTLKMWATRQKELFDTLKTLKSKTVIVDEETGEACDVYPPAKQSTTGLVITLSKPKSNG